MLKPQNVCEFRNGVEGGNWNAASVGESRRKMKVRSFLLSYPNLSLRHFVRCDHTLSLRHHTAGQTKATRKRNACLDASDFYRDRSAASSSAIDCRPGVVMAPIFMPREYVRHDNDNEARRRAAAPRVSPSSPLRNSIDRRNGSTNVVPSRHRKGLNREYPSIKLRVIRGGIHATSWRWI